MSRRCETRRYCRWDIKEQGRIIERERECAVCWLKAIVFNRSTFQSEIVSEFIRQMFSFYFLYARYWTFGFPQMHRFSLPPEDLPPSQDKGAITVFLFVSVRLTFRVTHEMSYRFNIPLKLWHHSIDVGNVRVNAVVHGKCDRCHQFVKWRTTGGWL